MVNEHRRILRCHRTRKRCRQATLRRPCGSRGLGPARSPAWPRRRCDAHSTGCTSANAWLANSPRSPRRPTASCRCSRGRLPRLLACSLHFHRDLSLRPSLNFSPNRYILKPIFNINNNINNNIKYPTQFLF